MKATTVLALALALFTLGTLTGAQTIVCDGHSCAGSGVVSYDGQLRDYVYRVTGGAVAPALDSVFIGTHDADLTHYSSICMPTGWAYEILPISRPDYSNPINHSVAAPAPDGTCPYTFLFRNVSGAALSPTTPTDFGFDYYGYPHTVDWMVAANPPVSANWSSGVGTGAGPVHGPRCDTLCEFGFPLPLHSLAGRKDNFATTDGSEPSSPTPALLAYMQTISGGADPHFDSPQNDRCFGHSFTGLAVPGCVIGARLCFRITAISEGNNDFINIREDATTPVWGPQIRFLKAWHTGNPADTFWTVGDTLEVCLDLANMPLIKRGTTYYWPTNILATLQDGDMDFLMSDDTKIDYLELFLDVCSDTCWATGDVNGDGTPLTLADLSALIDFVNNRVLPNGPLYQCDLNGDDHVDQLDIDIYTCYFQQGLSCFPVYPVPTDCDPDTIVGACCLIDTCYQLAEVNCLAHGGMFTANGQTCAPELCYGSISGTKYYDDNRNGEQDIGEGGLEGWNIILQGPVNKTTTTDANGNYSFTDLPPGPYSVNELMRPGWMPIFPQSGYGFSLLPGGDATKIDFGNWTCDTLDNRCCIGPAQGMLAWWPLDETGPSTTWDIASSRNGYQMPNIYGFGPGKVSGAYHFKWSSSSGVVRVHDDPFVDIGTGDFTIDAWIKPEHLGVNCGPHFLFSPCLEPIVDNREQWTTDGVCLFLLANTDKTAAHLGFIMNSQSVPLSYTTLSPVVALDVWQHVTVTVTRGKDKTPVGILYLNGVPVGAFTPIPGPLYTFGNDYIPGPNLDIGHSTWGRGYYTSCTCHQRTFDGWIDEVEVFNRALSPEEVYGIFHEDSVGKCEDYCHLPQSLALCRDTRKVTATLTICNQSSLATTYDWKLYGLCCLGSNAYLGIMTFNPDFGNSLLIEPWQCREVDIEITVPADFMPGHLGCYGVEVTNRRSGAIFGCQGSVLGINDWCPQIRNDSAITLASIFKGDSIDLKFTVVNTDDTDGVLNYEIGVRPNCSCDSSGSVLISLNGLPTGTDVTGSAMVPLGDSSVISVNAKLVDFAPFNVQEIVLSSDWDHDGTVEPGASTGLRPVTFPDCNDNGIDDAIDISSGFSSDSNSNAFPDECETFGYISHCPFSGDANADSAVNIGDAVYIINYVFRGGPAPQIIAQADPNGDCKVNVGDAVYLVNYIFRSGPAPICNEDCVW
jgi:hypothetical protein